MIKVLSLGNSFSQDAQRYLHLLAKGEGVEMKCVNLFIGGCSLQRHFVNMMSEKAEYSFEFNGAGTGIKVSIKDALLSDEWDYVTLQQASNYSPYYESYEPYLQRLAEYVRRLSPKSKILLHQTWAYEAGSERLINELGLNTPGQMLDMIKEAYRKAAAAIDADGIIPCGEAMLQLSECAVGKVHRDTFHADLGVGRYLLALVWFMYVSKKNVTTEFNLFDIETKKELADIAVKTASRIVFD